MPRARNIKPKITKNHKLAKLSYETRLLFSWLPMFANHLGILLDEPEQIHAEMFPFPKDRKLDIDKMLDQLQESGFIARYQAQPKQFEDPDENKFIKILAFHKHQNPHVKERKTSSIFPDYDPNSHKPALAPGSTGTDPADSLILIPDSPILIPDTPKQKLMDEIARFYKNYLSSIEIASGKRNLAKLAKTEDPEMLFQCAKNYYETLKLEGKIGTKYTIRMRNFYGRAARYLDYSEAPQKGPQTEKTGPEKAGVPTNLTKEKLRGTPKHF